MVYNNRCERGCQKWHPFCVSLRLIENEYQLFGGMPVWQKKDCVCEYFRNKYR